METKRERPEAGFDSSFLSVEHHVIDLNSTEPGSVQTTGKMDQLEISSTGTHTHTYSS